jgi:spermidine/putrescine transport system substrate-binding protein
MRYVIPSEGSIVWVDCMAIPKAAKNRKEALTFINYILRPEVGKQIALYTGYATPNMGAKALLPVEVQNNKAAYPDGNVLDSGELQVDIKDATELYDKAWTEIKSH